MRLIIKQISMDSDRNINSVVLHINTDLIQFIYEKREDIPIGVSSFFCDKVTEFVFEI